MQEKKCENVPNRIALEFTGERYVPEIEGQIALEHLHRYALACVLAEGKQVLDIASGEGYGSHLLAKVAANVIGVDISEEAIKHAKTKYTDSNLDFRTGSVIIIPVESNSIDLVVSFETIEHLSQHEEMLSEIKRVLKSDGILIISSPNKQNYSIIPSYANPYHVKELFRDEFENLLGRYFKNCRFSGQRIVYGSWIFPHEANRGGATYFELNNNAEIVSSAVPSIYEIAIASDVDSPMMKSSFLNQQIEKSEIVNVLNNHLGERDNEIARLNNRMAEQDERLSALKQELVERIAQITCLNQAVTERDAQIGSLNQAVTERDAQIASLVVERDQILDSTSWKITRPLRFIRHFGKTHPRRLINSLNFGFHANETLYFTEIKSLTEFQNYKLRRHDEYARRAALERASVGDARGFALQGYCAVCRNDTSFHADFEYAFTDAEGNKYPNWRERLVCTSCELNNRVRASIHLFRQECAPQQNANIYMTEQTTTLYAWMKRHYTSVVGSEYLGSERPPGETNSDGIRHESLTELSFEDNLFDYILSFDVLEHIPDYQAAIQECSRVLRPGGQMLFSVPFCFDSNQHIVRARMLEDGSVEHLMEPEYHGDPINVAGCLCFYHFGWQLLDEFREAGFNSVKALFYWSDNFGYLGGDQALFTATKGVGTPLL
jgi:2-polyprenyl-3-methyl-5-hydroxy-6-metoxy-1,4-benzoquinol methylase